jgi:hypothetical protein
MCKKAWWPELLGIEDFLMHGELVGYKKEQNQVGSEERLTQFQAIRTIWKYFLSLNVSFSLGHVDYIWLSLILFPFLGCVKLLFLTVIRCVPLLLGLLL